RLNFLGASRKQGYGGVPVEFFYGLRLFQIRKGQGRDRIFLLDREFQRFTASYQNFEAGSGGQQLFYFRGGVNYLVEVIQHQQDLAGPQVSLDRFGQGMPAGLGVFLGYSEPGGNRRYDQLPVQDYPQRDEKNTFLEGGIQF